MWQSETTLRARVASGLDMTRTVVTSVVTFAKTSLSQAFSYTVPRIQIANHRNCPTTGAVSVTVTGVCLKDNSRKLRIGATGCEGTTWVSTSSVVCRRADSVKWDLVAGITVAKQKDSLTKSLSYDAHKMTSIKSNVACTGSTSVTVMGDMLGIHDSSNTLRIGVTAAEMTHWVSQTTMVVRSSPGATSNIGIASTLLVNKVSLSNMFTYVRFRLSSHLKVNGPSSGAVSVTIIGRCLGCGPNPTMCMRLGITGQEATVWISESSLKTKTHSDLCSGAQHYVITSGTDRLSATLAFTYYSPVVPSSRCQRDSPRLVRGHAVLDVEGSCRWQRHREHAVDICIFHSRQAL